MRQSLKVLNNYLRRGLGRYLNCSKALYDCLIKPDPFNIPLETEIIQDVVKITVIFAVYSLLDQLGTL